MPRRPHSARLALAALMLAGAWGCAPGKGDHPTPAPQPAAGASEKPYEAEMLRPEAIRKRQLAGENILIVDVRSKGAFTEAHVKDALNMPWGMIAEGHTQLPKDRLMALYCT
jgi:3-mercaptopyruvate sulfurtransferase SseA